jgi:hypothetical protein
MMNGGDLYELAKILGHSNIKMTERYAKLGKQHIASTAREIWKLMGKKRGNSKRVRKCFRIVPQDINRKFLVAAKTFGMWWPGTESNRRRQPFQGCALPAELPGRGKSSLANPAGFFAAA